MRYVLFVRHGTAEKDSCGVPLGLSECGHTEVRRTLELLCPFLSDQTLTVLLCSSPETRALETAEMVCNAFTLPLYIENFLGCSNLENLGELVPFILSREAVDVLVLVGHEDLKIVPPILARKLWKKADPFFPELNTGGVILVDCKKEQYHELF